MRLNEVSYIDALPVEGYGPGFFRIGGRVHNGRLAILPTGVVSWGGYSDTATLMAAKDKLDVLFIGTGAEIAPVPAAFRQAFEAVGLGIEAMASPPACRTYNVLLGEGRRVGLALLPV